VNAQIAAAGAIFRRDLRLFTAARAGIAAQAASLVVTLALFHFLSRLLRVSRFDSADEYFAYVVVGLVILAVIYSMVGLTETLRAELLSGSFERMVLSAFGPVLGTMSMCLFPMVRSILIAAWAIAVAVAFFGLDLDWPAALLALPAGALAAIAFSGIALAVASLVVAFKQAPGMSLVVAGIALVSGLYFPTDLLPSWLRWLSEVQPFTPAVELMRHLLVGLPVPDPAWVYVLKLGAFAVVLVPAAAWMMSRAVEYGYRRGTILEY
jgi:ABC-2 type transport system permease protein